MKSNIIDLRRTSSRRLNLLTGKYILLSPQRITRPWNGQVEKIDEEKQPAYDKNCYLCPKNERISKEKNPDYKGLYHFPNDCAAINDFESDYSNKHAKYFNDEISKHSIERGGCEVLCYNHTHNKAIMHMSIEEISKVINLWQDCFQKISEDKRVKHIQIFESRGNSVGNSNLHPHGQIWYQNHIPTIPANELEQQKKYYKKNKKNLLLEYLKKELKINERIVYHNDNFAILVPYWAEWPYELLILPKKPLQTIVQLKSKKIIKQLAECLKISTNLYAQLFGRPKFGSDYMMGMHQKPNTKKEMLYQQFHMHYISPMLNSSRQKFQAGYEKFGEPQRDFSPEYACEQLKKQLKKITI